MDGNSIMNNPGETTTRLTHGKPRPHSLPGYAKAWRVFGLSAAAGAKARPKAFFLAPGGFACMRQPTVTSALRR